jgi:uncharacterized RDD family membrane protein YckC
MKMNVKSKRLVAVVIDVVALPLVVGFITGVAMIVLNVDKSSKTHILEILHLFRGLIFFRDFVYSPGRHLVGLELTDVKTGIRVCCYRGNFFIHLWKSIARNLLLIIPFVLVIGYLIEAVMVMTKGYRLADKWAGTEVVASKQI